MFKKYILIIALLISTLAITACERADYQHPLHRK